MAELPIRGATGRNLALDRLRAAIANGDVSPGQRLVEAELAGTFSVTRGGVRLAIDELVAEGLLERVVNRGARVRVVSVEEAVAILECRAVLEGLIAARAAERVTPRDIAALRARGAQLVDAVETDDFVAYSRLGHDLHQMVGRISGQTTATELIDRLRAQIVRHQFQLSLRPGRPRVSLQEHLAIVEGVASGDPERAERASRAHLHSVITALQHS